MLHITAHAKHDAKKEMGEKQGDMTMGSMQTRNPGK